MLLLAAWTAFWLGGACLAAGGRYDKKGEETLSIWTPFGWAFILWAIGCFTWVILGAL